ncbi:MAG TPA: M1 family aminopeptidase, partial [Terriglobales bacterium]|nr:M1 family aminopeptidase [Terriglobales bacterium]
TAGLLGRGGRAIDADHALLGPDSFWYPADVRGFFTAEARITAPSPLTVVHNGADEQRIERGRLRETSWRSTRPVGGLALVAGRYRSAEGEHDNIRYRVVLGEDIDLDANGILRQMAAANRTLTATFGASGFEQSTLFVSSAVRRAFNDGSGLMGVAIHYFRDGDHGFQLIAHELAHNWWGATVAEKWLTPATGGEWLVEGFATFSSWLAVEAEHGRSGLARAIGRDMFDPQHQRVISEMSAFDNLLNEAAARDTIYRKGGYAAFMLRQLLGAEPYYAALRAFLTAFRFQQATERDLQESLEQSTGVALGDYFDDWIRSRRLADLAVKKSPDGGWLLTNTGQARITGDIEVMTTSDQGPPPQLRTAKVGDRIEAEAGEIIVDPYLQWADPWRENNRQPARINPIATAWAGNGNHLITYGEPFPWSRTTITLRDGENRARHHWELQRGLTSKPLWSADGTQAVFGHADGDDPYPMTVLLRDDGARRNLGRGSSPSFAPDGTIYAARGEHIVAFPNDATETKVVERDGWLLGQPRVSPDGAHLAYSAAQDNTVEIRVRQFAGGRERRLLSTDRDRVLLEWSADSATLFVAHGGDSDWRISALPLDERPARVLAAGIVTLDDLARSPNGEHLAFTAAPDPTYPDLRSRLYVLTIGSESVATFDVADHDLEDIAWQSDNAIAAIAAEMRPGAANILPATRRIKRIGVRDQSQTDLD